MSSQYRRKQLAIRRLLLDQNGKLNPGARALAAELKKLCGGKLTQYDGRGAIDPIATAAAAQRREVWDHFVRLLHLEPFEAVNLREEEQ
jgi:hypothetical protein